jgi:undecaprenyl phosphate-alpha-L-ara4N flippase subunit ArnF
MRYFYVFATLLFTVYGQLILKWRIALLGFSLPESGLLAKFVALIRLIFDPFIFSGFMSAFIASLFWMAAMTKFQITEAYPFMSLAPAIVFILGVWLLGETFTIGKLVGLVLIMIGLIVTVKF